MLSARLPASAAPTRLKLSHSDQSLRHAPSRPHPTGTPRAPLSQRAALAETASGGRGAHAADSAADGADGLGVAPAATAGALGSVLCGRCLLRDPTTVAAAAAAAGGRRGVASEAGCSLGFRQDAAAARSLALILAFSHCGGSGLGSSGGEAGGGSGEATAQVSPLACRSLPAALDPGGSGAWHSVQTPAQLPQAAPGRHKRPYPRLRLWSPVGSRLNTAAAASQPQPQPPVPLQAAAQFSSWEKAAGDALARLAQGAPGAAGPALLLTLEPPLAAAAAAAHGGVLRIYLAALFAPAAQRWAAAGAGEGICHHHAWPQEAALRLRLLLATGRVDVRSAAAAALERWGGTLSDECWRQSSSVVLPCPRCGLGGWDAS